MCFWFRRRMYLGSDLIKLIIISCVLDLINLFKPACTQLIYYPSVFNPAKDNYSGVSLYNSK